MSEGPVYNAELKVKARVEVHGAMSRDWGSVCLSMGNGW
jgi:hypothetical protein